MDKILGFIGLVVVAFLLLILLATVGAYPTKWVVNYLFSPAFLTLVFGVGKLNFWHALALNFITATLFKATNTVKA